MDVKTRDLEALGIPRGPLMELAKRSLRKAVVLKMRKRQIGKLMKDFAADPGSFKNDAILGELATALLEARKEQADYLPRMESAPWKQWGHDLEQQSSQQMSNACALPISVRGALMPDAHPGYGLPIGGVLATRNAVIPYAVGVDIACRMKLSVTDLPVDALKMKSDWLRGVLEKETQFGIGASFRKSPRKHQIMDENWSISQVTRTHKDKAWQQLGTSGSGNHFVEYGIFKVQDDRLGMPAGKYLALLSHSGSRGTGHAVCTHYSKVASQQHPELPRHLQHLAWLDLNTPEGQEYWNAMQLMGRYAAANHECIHRHITKELGAELLLDVENHHNFAWKEEHDGEELIVHRKGATPAASGLLGVIPGTMATPTHIVRGLGNEASLQSAAHGAGRIMSRKKAKQTFTWKQGKAFLEKAGVTLISAGLDEVPMVYKDINQVMAAQTDLVETVATFMPKLVKMAPGHEPPED
jgi:tRNA-splicing ligase RtcB